MGVWVLRVTTSPSWRLGDEGFMEGGLSKPRPEGQMGVKQRVRGRVKREGDSRIRE